MMSYHNLDRKPNRATPEMYCNYKLALMLYKTHNDCLPESEWIALIFSQTLMSRQNYLHINKSNYNLVGLNIFTNRFHNLYDKIPLEWLNKTFLAFKIETKNKFIVYQS
jgi:hypothetical protein